MIENEVGKQRFLQVMSLSDVVEVMSLMSLKLLKTLQGKNGRTEMVWRGVKI